MARVPRHAAGRGRGNRAIGAYQRFADEIGFVVAAVDLPGAQDITEARYYYILHIVEGLRRAGTLGTQPVWIGGLSGGAKWAMHLGALGGDRFSGVLAIASNDDFATVGYQEYGNRTALQMPICLLNGTQDGVAGVNVEWYEPMCRSLKTTGFSNVMRREYDGGHSIPYAETVEAFRWLAQQRPQ